MNNVRVCVDDLDVCVRFPVCVRVGSISESNLEHTWTTALERDEDYRHRAIRKWISAEIWSGEMKTSVVFPRQTLLQERDSLNSAHDLQRPDRPWPWGPVTFRCIKFSSGEQATFNVDQAELTLLRYTFSFSLVCVLVLRPSAFLSLFMVLSNNLPLGRCLSVC